MSSPPKVALKLVSVRPVTGFPLVACETDTYRFAAPPVAPLTISAETALRINLAMLFLRAPRTLAGTICLNLTQPSGKLETAERSPVPKNKKLVNVPSAPGFSGAAGSISTPLNRTERD